MAAASKLTRVAVDARNLGPTGIGRYTQELVAALADRYPHIHWHLLVEPTYALTAGAALFDRPNVSAHPTTAGYYSLAEQLTLGHEIDSLGADIAHFTNFNAPYNLRTPLIATVHDLTLLTHPGRRMWPGKRWLYRQVLRRTLAQARLIITGSRDAKKDITAFARRYRLAKVARRIRLIPHGVADLFRQPLPPRDLAAGLADLGLVNPYFLVVGAQLKHKNVHRVAAAFADLLTDPAFAAYKLVVAGQRTAPAPYLDTVLRWPLLRDRVHFTGPVSDGELRLLYRGATALVFASQKEGFGLPILEAFAARCPVIASRVSSIPEVGGEAVWYVNPLRPASLVAAMRRVQRDKRGVARRVRAGYRRADRYRWEHSAAATYQVYEEIQHFNHQN